jgi:hypothetical protein
VQALREFVAHKVTLIVPGRGIDTSKVSSKVFLDTLDAVSEFKHFGWGRSGKCKLGRSEGTRSQARAPGDY